MDLSKMGKLIASIRKEKGLTQDQLGKKLGVLGKTVSKWERGINAPDISLLGNLSDELGITVNELLIGSKNEKEEKLTNLPLEPERENKIIVESINYYYDRIKNKSIKIMLALSLVIFILFSIIFTFSNYNRSQIYSINTDNNELTIEGYLIFNQSQKIIIISDINYINEHTGTLQEPKIKNLKIKLISNDKIIYENYFDITNSNTIISNVLGNININYKEMKDEKKETLNKEILNNLKLIIEYEDENDKINNLEYKIIAKKEFSNNKLFY